MAGRRRKSIANRHITGEFGRPKNGDRRDPIQGSGFRRESLTGFPIFQLLFGEYDSLALGASEADDLRSSASRALAGG